MHVRCGMHVPTCVVRACALYVRALYVRDGLCNNPPPFPIPAPPPKTYSWLASIDIDEIEETIREDVNSCASEKRRSITARPEASQGAVAFFAIRKSSSCPSSVRSFLSRLVSLLRNCHASIMKYLLPLQC